jgi:hypothetical protein
VCCRVFLFIEKWGTNILLESGAGDRTQGHTHARQALLLVVI